MGEKKASIKNVLVLFWYFKQTRITMRVNGLLFYLQKIPIIGNYFPMVIYREYRLKRSLFRLLFALEILGKVVGKFIWLIIPVAVLGFSMGGLVIWWFLIPLIIAFYTAYSFTIDRGQVDFTRFYQLSRVRFLRSAQLLPIFLDALAYLPAAVFVGWIIGRPLATPVFVLLSYLAGYFVMMYVGRLLFNVTQQSFPRVLIGFVAVLPFVGAFIKLFVDGQQERLANYLLQPWMSVVFFLLFISSFWMILHFKEEEHFFEVKIEKTDEVYLKVDKAGVTEHISEGLKMQEALTLDETKADSQLEHLRGSDYLNRLLFSRYRKQLNRSLYYRVILFAGVLLSVAILGYFGLLSELNEDQSIRLFPLLFFAMYLLTMGKKIVQMVYINCDSAMLYYPFYREKSAILSGFYARFKETLRYNSLIVAGFLLIFLEIHLLNQLVYSYRFFFLLLLLLVSLAFLFSFHELFVYYLLQPFSSDLETVNPVYTGIQYVLYFIAYMNLQIKITGFAYIGFVCTTVAIYVGIGLFIITKYAPKTFKIK